jgi:imidazolonepropionase-like amidohydrolase
MRKSLLCFCIACWVFVPTNAQSVTTSVFLLHKFQQNIGKENFVVEQHDTVLKYTIDFKFTDRGSPVPLKAVIQTKTDGDPISFAAKGKTSRFSVLSDTVAIQGQKAYIHEGDNTYTKPLTGPAFPVAGYSPGTAQMLMLQYWKRHGRPSILSILPSGSVQIRMDGLDTVNFNGQNLLLERYIIGGLIWGNELVWADQRGQLYCLITNDAEGDKLEMMLEPYESLLPVFIKKAAVYSMQLFAKDSRETVIAPKVIAIVGGKIIDVVNKKTMEDFAVLIENGMIKSVGPSSKIKIPTDAYIVDAKNKSILPGLWDMHAHFEQAEWGPAYLAAGVTTVRDCGNEFDYINAIQTAIDGGKGIGPHILKAGIIDGTGPFGIGIIQAGNEEEGIKAVQRYKDNGFVQIKIYSSVKPKVVKAICLEAHRLGMTVTGHIPQGMNLIEAVDSGMDMVNHLQYVVQVLKKNKNDIDFSDSANKAVFDFIRNHHIVIDPTLGIYEMNMRSLKDSMTRIEPAFATVPAPLQSLFVNTGLPPEQAQARIATMERLKQTMKALYDHGILIVAGTDMGIPGFSVFREMELYVQAGLTPADALQTATIIPARAMNMDKNYGSVEPGKQADIIIVDGNPFQNISEIRKINTVIKDGKIYDPASLHLMAGFSK